MKKGWGPEHFFAVVALFHPGTFSVGRNPQELHIALMGFTVGAFSGIFISTLLAVASDANVVVVLQNLP